MKCRTRTLLSVVAMVALMAAGCGGDSETAQTNANGTEVDAGTGDDADGDGEFDADSDADSGADGDGDAGEPGVPGQVQASQGESPDWVLITWEPVEGAQGYQILRDGGVVGEVMDGLEMEYIDDQAGPPSVLQAPYNLTATDDRGAGILLAWEFDDPEAGPAHQYQIQALFEDGAGPISETVEGYRGPYPVEFSVRVQGQPWVDVGNVDEYLDEEAPYGQILSPGRVRATKGAYTDRVQLHIDDLVATVGDQVSYEVRATDGAHTPRISNSATGRRGIATPIYQWQRSEGGAPENFVDITGSSAPYGDLTAPEDGTIRYWRARVSYPGDAPQLTEPGWGWRAVSCPTDINFFGQVSHVNNADGLEIPLTREPLTQDANLQAIWDAAVPAPNWEAPQELAPGIVISEATVIATSFREGRHFWLQDADSTMQVYLDDALSSEVRVGQNISFTATEVSIFNGNPQVTSLTNFSVVSEENPVPYFDLRTEEVDLDDHYYRLVRLGGELGAPTSCAGDYLCYELTYGPTGGERTVEYRSSSELIEEGSCVTYLGPVIGYPGPRTTFDDAPAPQLQTDHFHWQRVVN